ncbi:hypothetical protein PMI09_05027 [Rhizobium sp. CF122]|nr:hypothetical protein [Rhizobium sp. CF122]EJL50530.1 hypothetical protein PMI09_05027 [Rhizobium sp. CF122]
MNAIPRIADAARLTALLEAQRAAFCATVLRHSPVVDPISLN